MDLDRSDTWAASRFMTKEFLSSLRVAAVILLLVGTGIVVSGSTQVMAQARTDVASGHGTAPDGRPSGWDLLKVIGGLQLVGVLVFEQWAGTQRVSGIRN